MSIGIPASDPIHNGVTFGEMALQSMRRWGDRVAVVHEGRTITYRQMEAGVNRMARALEASGFGPGQGVVSLTGNMPEALSVVIATVSLGGHHTALHPLGSAEDHAFVLDDSEATTFVYNAAVFDDRAAEILERASGLDRSFALGSSDHAQDLIALSESESDAKITTIGGLEDLVSIPYSSGTTGKPKGVLQPHRCAVEMSHLSMPGWQLPTRDVRFLAVTPISHASIAFVLPTWIHGGTIVLESGFDPDRFCRVIEEQQITLGFVVPTVLYVLLDHLESSPADLSSLETVVYGAAPMSPARLGEALERFGDVFVQLYGQAEAPACLTALRKEEHDTTRPELLSSCGQPLPGVRVEIHDDDDGEVGVGEVGEICAQGRLVSNGYWKRPELTEETFKNGWLHTGDMARRDDEGYYYIVDRKKDMVITGGMNIFPREVEDVLTSHVDVSMAAVVGVPDEQWGEAIKAVVVPRAGATINEAELTSLVRNRKGPVFAPKSVDVVDSLPLTAIGKPDKKALRAQYWGERQRAVN